MPLFLSTYINKVDTKGRISVPASFRNALADQNFQGIIVFKSTQHLCLEGFAWNSMQEISERLDHYDLFSNAQDDLATSIFAEARQLPFDGDGRIILPEDLRDFCHIKDHAAFIGMGRKFQIWSPPSLEKRTATVRKKLQDSPLSLPKKDVRP